MFTRHDGISTPKEAEIVREIFRMHGEGCGLRTIVKTLNGRGVPAPRAGKRGSGSWSMSSIRPMLQRERYRGVIVYGRIQKAYKNGTGVRLERPDDQVTCAEAPHLRIASDAQWDAAQERFRENGREPWRKATPEQQEGELGSVRKIPGRRVPGTVRRPCRALERGHELVEHLRRRREEKGDALRIVGNHVRDEARLIVWAGTTPEATPRYPAHHLESALVALGMVANLLATIRYGQIRRAIDRGDVSAPGALVVYVFGVTATLVGLVMTILLLRALGE